MVEVERGTAHAALGSVHHATRGDSVPSATGGAWQGDVRRLLFGVFASVHDRFSVPTWSVSFPQVQDSGR
jgi:hypothetical protein